MFYRFAVSIWLTPIDEIGSQVVTENPTLVKECQPFVKGFLFLITFINGFQLLTIKRFCNKANEKRQNNKK